MELGDRGSESWTPMGTPEYAAPELYDKNASPDHRADIYSLGVVLHEMLTGTPPVGEFELPGEALGLDPRVDDIIVRCMEFKPEDRFQTAAEVRTLVREIIEQRNVPVRKPAKTAGKRIFKAPRRNPAAVRKHGPASQPIAAAAASRKAAPVTRPEARGAVKPGGRSRGRVRKVVVVQGSGSQGSADMQRNLLIGGALLVIAVAAFLIFSRSGKKDTPAEGGNSPGTGSQSSAGTEAGPAPVPITAGTETRSTPPPPEPKPPVKPDPKPETPSKTAEATPTAAFAKLHELRITYRDEWNTRVESKFSEEFARLSSLYTRALQGLEDKYLGKGDAALVLTVRTESQRFEKTKEPARDADVSSNPELARIQQSLAAQVDRLRNGGLKYDADSVKEKYLLAIKALEREMDDKGDNAGSKAADAEFQKAATLKDSALRDYFNQE
jgi:serine/threonine protein kinase